MFISRRSFLVSSVTALASPASAGGLSFEFKSLRERAKWRSFGGDDWAHSDPYELARSGTQREAYSTWKLRRSVGQTGQLLDLIAFAEAGKAHYNAVHFGARKRPPGQPTDLTIGQIIKWIKATPGQPHAIGRYQFIPSTLAWLVARSKISENTRFDEGTQDALANLLLHDAGYAKFVTGKLSMRRFMDNLAKIWAGLPLKNGRSAYDGYAGNRATITRSFYEAQMKAIFA